MVVGIYITIYYGWVTHGGGDINYYLPWVSHPWWWGYSLLLTMGVIHGGGDIHYYLLWVSHPWWWGYSLLFTMGESSMVVGIFIIIYLLFIINIIFIILSYLLFPTGESSMVMNTFAIISHGWVTHGDEHIEYIKWSNITNRANQSNCIISHLYQTNRW